MELVWCGEWGTDPKPDPTTTAEEHPQSHPSERASELTHLGVVQEHESVPLRRHVLRGNVQHVEQRTARSFGVKEKTGYNE